MAEDAEDKKHDPSERSLREAADRGEMPRSNDLSGAVALLAASSVVLWSFPDIAEPIRSFALQILSVEEFDLSSVQELLAGGLLTLLWSAGPVLAAGAIASILTSLAQTRFQVAPRAFEASIDRLDPLATAQRVYFSREPLVALAKGLVQVLLLGGVVAWVGAEMFDELPGVTSLSPFAQLQLLGALATRIISAAVPAMLLLAGVDYAWSYWTWWNSLMRTDQQMRDDYKETEGDPHVRGHRKRRMREIAYRRGVAAVKDATVLVTNPTHYAVALRYRHGEDEAPVVVAKGVDHLAAVLRREAKKHDVPWVEDRRLARALYAQVKLDSPVPAELYGAVARVLAVVYRRKKRVLSRSRAPSGRRRPGPRTAPRRSGANRPATGS